jgi:subtilase family serine protease
MTLKKIFAMLCVLASLSIMIVGTTGMASARSSSPSTPSFVHSCSSAVPAGYAWCQAILAVNSQFRPDSGGPSGYHPADLQSAYKLPSASSGNGQTIAIVDAFDDPNAEADLGVYRSTFGLSACTTGNGCFKKVNENGGTSYPSPNTGWAEEISLDVDMVSAICPNCHILLVEASSSSFSDLGTAVNTAASLGANAISNSYLGGESSGEQSIQNQYYTHPGIAITAASGDGGYGTGAPAVFNTLTAVGGTSLVAAPKKARGWKETVWSGAGSGCSRYISKPSWQTDKKCSNRTVSDVSAVADPNTGVAVYDTYNQPGFEVFGGTSVATPIIASVYGLAGNESSINPGYPYSHTSSLFDVKKGSNGSCGGSYLCTAKKGYDGPTGLGTPDGSGAF